MPTEIEAKFLHVDHEALRVKLKALGAQMEKPMRLMRRSMFDYPDDRFQKLGHSRRLRVRDEGDKITVTYKESSADSKYAQEVETIVGDFEAMKELFIGIGLKSYSYQESKRETWRLDDVEVELDEWPWVDEYIEIEGPSEKSIKAAAEKLGFNWDYAEFGSVDTAYLAQYPGMKSPDSIGDVPEVRFDSPLPDYFKKRLTA